MRAKRVSACLFVAAVISFVWAGGALCQNIPPDVMDARTVSKLGAQKLERGLINVATGWCELIRCPIEAAHDKGTPLAAPLGVGKGIGMGIIRTVGGVFEAGLFFHPLPWEYRPYFESPTVFSNWPTSS